MAKIYGVTLFNTDLSNPSIAAVGTLTILGQTVTLAGVLDPMTSKTPFTFTLPVTAYPCGDPATTYVAKPGKDVSKLIFTVAASQAGSQVAGFFAFISSNGQSYFGYLAGAGTTGAEE